MVRLTKPVAGLFLSCFLSNSGLAGACLRRGCFLARASLQLLFVGGTSLLAVLVEVRHEAIVSGGVLATWYLEELLGALAVALTIGHLEVAGRDTRVATVCGEVGIVLSSVR